MKNFMIGVFCAFFTPILLFSQDNQDNLPLSVEPDLKPILLKPNPFMLPIAKSSIRGSYPIEVSYIKTTHIVFPSKIIEFDAGSSDVIATIPEKVQNVLRIKADEKGFYEETNITVLTEDGGLFSFLVRYNDHPDVFTINMSNNQVADRINTAKLGIGLTSNSSPNTFVLGGGAYDETTFVRDAQDVLRNKSSLVSFRNIGARKNGLRLTLETISINKATNTMYLRLLLKNSSYLPYEIDFIKVFIRDRNVMKRTAVQEEELPVLHLYPAQSTLGGNEEFSKVIAIPGRTLTDGKILEVEMYEKSGGRHLRFEIDNASLVKTKTL